MKKLIIIPVMIVLVLISFLIGSYFFLAEDRGFTPIFCTEYEYKCCVLDSVPEPGGGTNILFYQCPPDAESCKVISATHVGGDMFNYREVSQYKNYMRKATDCKIEVDWLGTEYSKCENYVILYRNDEVQPGDFIVSTYQTGINSKKMAISTENEVYKLFDCGTIPCGKYGTWDISATCSLVGDWDRVYDEDGNLKDKTFKGYGTIPRGDCYKTATFANRRICGYYEEKCADNSDCANLYPYRYTYGGEEYGATCSQNTLTLYGCVIHPTEKYCGFGIDEDADGEFEDETEECLEYNTFSYCGVAAGKQVDVECCPDATYACGPNLVCNPETFKCETTRECTYDLQGLYDWQCEAAGVSCDFTTKTIKDWGCLADGTCGIKSERDVECCADANCASGYFCDNNKCYERIKPKVDCPFMCCSNEDDYYDKPCPTKEPYCCPDHLCAISLEACGTPPDVCNDNGVCEENLGENAQNCPGDCAYDWTWLMIVAFAGIFAVLGYALKKGVGAFAGLLLGGILGYGVYIFISMPWWQQILLGLGLVGGGAILIYIVILAIPALIAIAVLLRSRK